MNTLQKALLSNGIFSGVSGLILILFQKPIAQLFGTSNNTVFWIIGIALLYFASTVFWEYKKQRKTFVILIIVQDILWVLGSLILLIFDPFEITITGEIIIVLVGIVVLGMGIWQWWAIAKKNTN